MPHTKTPGTGNKIVGVTLDSELYRRKPVLTYAISSNIVGGFSEFGELLEIPVSTVLKR